MSQQDNQNNDVLIQSSNPEQSAEYIAEYLEKKQAEYDALPDDCAEVDRSRLQLDIAEALVGLNRGDEAWEKARNAFDVFIRDQSWQEAVEACDVLYQSGQSASLVALAHGVWLSVTYPVAPQSTVTMLSYVVDETPPKADGAAVAAIAAHYVADMRAEGKEHESLTFLTREMIANVAKAHSDVESQEALNIWMEKLELLDPGVFLPRLALVINAIVPENQWWIDRDALREQIPE